MYSLLEDFEHTIFIQVEMFSRSCTMYTGILVIVFQSITYSADSSLGAMAEFECVFLHIFLCPLRHAAF